MQDRPTVSPLTEARLRQTCHCRQGASRQCSVRHSGFDGLRIGEVDGSMKEPAALLGYEVCRQCAASHIFRMMPGQQEADRDAARRRRKACCPADSADRVERKAELSRCFRQSGGVLRSWPQCQANRPVHSPGMPYIAMFCTQRREGRILRPI